MSRRDPLDLVIRDAHEDVRSQLGEAGRRRDFAAMVARARAIDPSAVSAEDAAEASTFAPVVVLHGGPRRIDAAADQMSSSPGPRRLSRGMLALAVGLAAALLLSLAGAGPLARRHVAALRGEAASHHVAPSPHYDRAVLRDDGPTTSPADGGRGGEPLLRGNEDEEGEGEGDDALLLEALDPLTPLDLQLDAPQPDKLALDELALDERSLHAPPPTELRDPTPTTGSETPPRSVEAIPTRPPSDALDHEARAAWRSGDLQSASVLFEALIAAENDPKRVELAFGDLLLIARQLGEHGRLARIRRDYLRRFPAGVYAEDVRSELCRAKDEPACERAYDSSSPSDDHADRREQRSNETDPPR